MPAGAGEDSGETATPDSHRADGERALAASLPTPGGHEMPFPEPKWGLRREGIGGKHFRALTQS